MLDRLESLALELAPELSSTGLQLLWHQDEWPLPGGAMAYAIRGRILHLREYLRAAGRWNGAWGSFLIFNHRGEWPEMVALLIHELAHQLPAQPPIMDDDLEPTAEQRAYQGVQLATWATMRREADPWTGHDARWIRRVLHLRHRAKRIGHDVPLISCNVAGAAYALSPASHYEIALATEPWYSAGKSFAEIDREPMLPQFRKLFATDVATYHYDRLNQEPRNG